MEKNKCDWLKNRNTDLNLFLDTFSLNMNVFRENIHFEMDNFLGVSDD